MRIASYYSDRLLTEPETGMGWQLVEVSLSHNWIEHIVVLNAEALLEFRLGEARLLREGESGDRGSRVAGALRSGPPKLGLRVLSRSKAIQEGLIPNTYRAGSGPASEAAIEKSELGEKFLRFSAFEKDRRISADGSVVAGTYVTTHDDGKNVRTGLEAVDRYALPNPDPAVNRFHLRPPVPILVRRGVVQPAFGHRGGGIEVIFEKGAPRGTLFSKDRIPSGLEKP